MCSQILVMVGGEQSKSFSVSKDNLIHPMDENEVTTAGPDHVNGKPNNNGAKGEVYSDVDIGGPKVILDTEENQVSSFWCCCNVCAILSSKIRICITIPLQNLLQF